LVYYFTPNSIYNWTQLERIFHEKFFREETRVSLIDLMNVERCNIETIDDNLNQFRQLKLRCYTQIQEHEFIRMVVVGLKFSF